MGAAILVIRDAVARARGRWLAVSLGFVVAYYAGLLLFTMLRFAEVPNYVEFHDLLGTYRLILDGTPVWSDRLPILLDEPWFETGYKNPHYYGVATWSYMLIPPRMLLVFLAGALLATVAVLARYGQEHGRGCPASPARAYTAAGFGSALVGLTSATLTWVVCCASPTWVVALAMLGMSASLALWLEPLGKVLLVLGLLVFAGAIAQQLRALTTRRSAHLAWETR
ncbi:MAG TPA: hypothetical protein VFR86_19490 [Burkholderiaceae bacterium]|nr:hypothetical protein [Burkholderiaceae bacterium]